MQITCNWLQFNQSEPLEPQCHASRNPADRQSLVRGIDLQISQRKMVGSIRLVVFLSLFNSLVLSDQNESEQVGAVIETINDFGFDLLKIFNREQKLKDENIFYSPTSIAVSLAMVFLGSRENTAQQIAKALKWYSHEFEDVHLALKSLQEAITESEHENLELKIANRIWGHEHLDETAEFVESALTFYNTLIAKVDFKKSYERAREEINEWVEQNTARKIKGFLPPGAVNQDTRLALINAIYFKGTWLHEFTQEKTHHARFHTGSDRENVVEVEMMSRTSKHSFFVDKENNCKVIELPYSGDSVAMLVILPNEINGVSQLEQMINTEMMSQWIMSLENTTVKVSIPKFILSQHFELKEVLSKLGISDLFEPGVADLSGLSSVESLYVSHVIHKAHVDVNERGTEAAAASGVVMQKRSLDMPPEFYADHPFLFVIYHKSSNAILFIGRVKTPEVTEQEHDTVRVDSNSNSAHQSDEL